jgi:hypothetical protein
MAEDPTVRARSAATGIRQQIAASVLQQQLEEMLKAVFSGPQLKQIDKWIAEYRATIWMRTARQSG